MCTITMKALNKLSKETLDREFHEFNPSPSKGNSNQVLRAILNHCIPQDADFVHNEGQMLAGNDPENQIWVQYAALINGTNVCIHDTCYQHIASVGEVNCFSPEQFLVELHYQCGAGYPSEE